MRREPRLNWTLLSELLGEEFLRQRLVLLSASIKFEALDAETAAAYEIEDQIARGEIDPKSVAGLDLVSPAGRVTPDPEAQGGA